MPHSGCSALHGVNPNLKKKIYNFKLIYPRNLLLSLKVAYILTVSIVFSVYKENFTTS